MAGLWSIFSWKTTVSVCVGGLQERGGGGGVC